MDEPTSPEIEEQPVPAVMSPTDELVVAHERMGTPVDEENDVFVLGYN